MEVKTALIERHKKSSEILRNISAKKMEKRRSTQIAAEVGLKIGVSAQTVLNYIGGNCKDGYTTEALISEFRKLKTAK